MLPELIGPLLSGALTTLEISMMSLVVAICIGLLLAVLESFPRRLPRTVIRLYVEVFRGIPVLPQLFILYFGLAQVGLRLDPFTAAVAGFGLNGGAYLSEVFRAGLQSIPKGQSEAAAMIGMTHGAALRYVLLPQTMRVVLPSLANYAVGLLKDTTLASAVAAPELSFQARELVTRTFLSGPVYLLAAAIYVVLSLPLAALARAAEARLKTRRLP
ncbi:amino acid ABC transporter permease [Paraburkholderia caribensis]|uniref:amino acid ABC transporter permease n=1 Tax=Paraburkholderia caribensis TaxID=75105 RepID=UPI001F3CEEFE|nr:amino acid ABC transporter permease [Paraburkholderia caribensis]